MKKSDNQPIYTVSQLNQEVKQILQEIYPPIWIEGELSNFRQPSSAGHWYFCLKDTKAQISCAMFRMHNQFLGFKPKDGMHVLALARVSLYEARGDFQLVVEHLEEAGFGQLQRAFEVLKQKLAAEGLFDAAHKKSLPTLPKRIGIVTSATGAAVRDVLSVLKRRFASIPVIIYPTAVQGGEAAKQIVSALELANARQECDVLILTRGGGSIEDLWPFNEEIVARAIFQSEIPIISGVGHEIDFTIADFVADLRAPTPSAAAEIVTPDSMEYESRTKQLFHRLHRCLHHLLFHHQQLLQQLQKRLRHPRHQLFEMVQRLDHLEQRLLLAQNHELRHKQATLNHLLEKLYRFNPKFQITSKRCEYEYLISRLMKNMQHYLHSKKHELQNLMRALNVISPLNILDRGYAILQKDNHIIKDATQVKIGDSVKARLHQGELICLIEKINPKPS